MGKGVDAMVEKRRRQSSYLEIQKKKKESIPQYFESPGEVTVDFMLYMEHFDQESNLIDAVLNYYEIAYKKVFLFEYIFFADLENRMIIFCIWIILEVFMLKISPILK